ncbi:MAG: phosphoenolpyruvate--protein phosphotransferase [Rhodospirillaceae bacterium]|nr:phosphoenolpyruvate--protein phosphotransferase [Rhodospirillaceae bacterium]
MAGSGAAQVLLDKIVQCIAAEMGAEVCSCYVLRAGDVLELFSTVGLNPAAVHRTRLRLGEGLVGMAAGQARPVVATDASSHPSFAYRPETGEDIFNSLLGVPILRGGAVRGVLVIQNRERRAYTEEEVEVLQTVAMVVAEVVARSDRGPADEAPPLTVESANLPMRLEGASLSPGIADGQAVLHRPRLTMRQMVSDEPSTEHRRLDAAIRSMHRSIDDLLARSEGSGSTESQDILEAYRMFAEDRGWTSRIREAIDSGLSAEAAVQKVQEWLEIRRASLSDPYLAERFQDFEDLANHLLLHLSGRGSVAGSATLPANIILVARSLGPAELMDYGLERVRAIVLETGTANSHVAIIARALGIPVIGRCARALRLIEPLDPVIVDGDHGQVFLRPSEDAREHIETAMLQRAARQRIAHDLADQPAVTRDGVHVSLNLNAGLLAELHHLPNVGAEGVGLYRTEIPFMVRPSFPGVAEQTEMYGRVLAHANDLPVTFRTLDVGGDKSLPYFHFGNETNPLLGWRAIRIGLDHPAMLRTQLRALLRAAAGRPVRIMFPMIADLPEFAFARSLLDRERDVLGVDPATVAVGAMLEVPSILWSLPGLLSNVDFVAVGTNDLVQYVFAADRGNARVAPRYDPLSPTFLEVLSGIVEQCAAAGVEVSVCGEMAGRPLDALALLGLGYRSLSMTAWSIGPVKAMVRSINMSEVDAYVRQLRRGGTRGLRESLRGYALDRGIPL